MAEKMSRRLVLLSSAAIAAVYVAGYLDTRTADASLAAASGPTAADTRSAAVVASSSVATSSALNSAGAPPGLAAQGTEAPAGSTAASSDQASVARSNSAAGPSHRRAVASTATTVPPTVVPPTVLPTSTPTPTSQYRDGTYTGLGTSRRGDIEATVTVSGGRITNVAISDATTQYPVSWIRSLPGEVVAQQSAQVDLISGATYSSLAFRGAVQQALAQAQGRQAA